MLRKIRFLAALAGAALIAACGGGSGGSSSPPIPAPSSLSYPAAPAFEVGHAITSLSPTVSGTVSAYAVNPALPAGLTLDGSSGVISGTPTAITAMSNYTVTASNGSGSTTTMVSLTVNDAPPNISYGTTSVTLTKQSAATLTATNSGGAVVSWSISPALPAGLTFSTTTGGISGTPTATANAASYLITAKNSGGASMVNLKLAIQSVLLNLGHNGQIDLVRLSASRALSHDAGGWVLWDSSSAAMIAYGGAACVRPTGTVTPQCIASPLLDLAGSIFIVEILGGLEIHATADGSLIARISNASYTWWKLAPDGSYVAVGGPNGLTIWSSSGSSMLSRTGNYANAQAFASPSAVRVALGPAGVSVIESISVPGGTSTTTPAFQGTFNSWFKDGAAFLTNTGNTIWVYGTDGTQKDLKALSAITNLGGQGNWFWSYENGGIDVFAVGASTTPAASFALTALPSAPMASGSTVGILADVTSGIPSTTTGVVHVIDLSGATPVMVDHTTPAFENSAYAALSSTEWFVGNNNGTLLDGATLGGTLKYFGYGHTFAVAAGGSRAAIATAVGKVLVFDLTSGAIEETISAPDVSGLAMSADGSVLATEITNLDTGFILTATAVQVYTLPGATLTYSSGSGYASSCSLSALGSVLACDIEPTPGGSVVDLSTQATIWSGAVSNPIRLSPDGTLLAISDTTNTNIYLNGVLSTAVTGWAVGWLDNTHLLIERPFPTAYTGSVIVNPSGATVSTPAPHDFEDPFQILGLDAIYDPNKNTIFSVSTGTATWSSDTPSTSVAGAAGASSVVFVSGSLVISEPY